MSEWEEDKNKYIYTMYVSIYEKERTTTTKTPTTSTSTRQEQQVRGNCPTFLLYFDRFDVVTKLCLGVAQTRTYTWSIFTKSGDKLPKNA